MHHFCTDRMENPLGRTSLSSLCLSLFLSQTLKYFSNSITVSFSNTVSDNSDRRIIVSTVWKYNTAIKAIIKKKKSSVCGKQQHFTPPHHSIISSLNITTTRWEHLTIHGRDWWAIFLVSPIAVSSSVPGQMVCVSQPIVIHFSLWSGTFAGWPCH